MLGVIAQVLHRLLAAALLPGAVGRVLHQALAAALLLGAVDRVLHLVIAVVLLHGVMALVMLTALMVVQLPGVTLHPMAITPQLCLPRAIDPLFIIITAVTVQVKSRRRVSPVWR